MSETQQTTAESPRAGHRPEPPFTKRVDRNNLHSFFEHHGWGEEEEEAYYRFLFDFVRERMEKDPGLKGAYGTTFQSYPHGQHHHEDFHLHGHRWAVRTADLGTFIGKTVYPAMTEAERADFAERHAARVAELDREAGEKPHEEPDDIPAFRHT